RSKRAWIPPSRGTDPTPAGSTTSAPGRIGPRGGMKIARDFMIFAGASAGQILAPRPGARREGKDLAMIPAFTDGAIEGVGLRPLRVHHDARGWLVELFRQDELEPERWPAMTYVSETLPGVTRGPHEHVDQTDGFAFIGPSDFRLYLWDTRETSPTRGRCTV